MKNREDKRERKHTFDSVSTLTSKMWFLYLYSAAMSPVDSPPFFTAVEMRP